MGFKETEVGRIPEEWELFELKDLAQKIGSGATPRGGKKVYLQSGIPFIRSQNIYNCKFLKDGIVYINEESASKLNNVKLYKNDVLLNITGDSVARCTMLPEKYIGGRVNQHVVIIRSHVEILNPNFLKYYLVSDNMQAYMLSLAKMGATRAALTKGMIESFKVPTPPIDEQKAIANILSTLDEKIEINNRINKNLEQIAQTIFKHWFVDFEFPDEDGNPYKSSGGEMIESELGMIPKGWEVGSLGDSNISKILKSGIKEFKGEKIYLATADVEDTFIINTSNNITFKDRPSRANMQPKINTIWFAKMKDSKKLILVDDYSKEITNNYIFSTGFSGIECNIKYLYYLWTYINSIEFHEIKDSLCNGTTMQAINNKNIKLIFVVIPPKYIIKKFYFIIKKIYKNVHSYKLQNKILTNLRDTLLPKLMSGEIRVPLDN